jgi:hypothetical protein
MFRAALAAAYSISTIKPSGRVQVIIFWKFTQSPEIFRTGGLLLPRSAL